MLGRCLAGHLLGNKYVLGDLYSGGLGRLIYVRARILIYLPEKTVCALTDRFKFERYDLEKASCSALIYIPWRNLLKEKKRCGRCDDGDDNDVPPAKR